MFNVDEAMIYGLLSEYKSMQKIPADGENSFLTTEASSAKETNACSP